MEEEYVSVFRFYRNKESVSRCGYCCSRNTLYKNDMWAYYLTALDYQHLIDRGWRRSGHYLYKPINQKTCCPMYTIRCDVEKFRLSKSQKKVLKIINDFLTKGKLEQVFYKKKNGEWKLFLENGEGGIPAPFDIKDLIPDDHKTNSATEHDGAQKSKTETKFEGKEDFPGVSRSKKEEQGLGKRVLDGRAEAGSCTWTRKGKNKRGIERPSPCDEKMLEVMEVDDPSYAPSSLQPGPMHGAPRPKAKVIRLENKIKKLTSKGFSEEEAQEKLNSLKASVQPSSQLEDYLLKGNNGKNKLRVCLVRTSPKSEEYWKTEQDEFLLYKKYQISVHGDPPDGVTIEGFRRFLVESPLEASYPTGGPTSGYGSFHQQYWLNEKLVAVGVIDILPYCVSSVYFFYDTDFKAFSLGTYGSLREISFVRNLRQSVPSIKFYYMGYYIHSCPKMKYKGNFSPSYLLCPETYTWHAIEKCLPKLETSKYSRLEEDPSKCDEHELNDLRKVVINYRGAEMHYYTYRSLYPDPDDDEFFHFYGRLIGSKCASNMLYVKI